MIDSSKVYFIFDSLMLIPVIQRGKVIKVAEMFIH